MLLDNPLEVILGRELNEVREPGSYLGGEHSRQKDKQEDRINSEDAEG